METIIYIGEAKWGRPTYIKLVNDKVVYDNSDEEYGPTEFDIKTLIEALNKHLNENSTIWALQRFVYTTNIEYDIWNQSLLEYWDNVVQMGYKYSNKR